MITLDAKAETIMSAPNIAPGSGMYFPDRARMRTINVGWNMTYECDRCRNNGANYCDGVFTTDCGRQHFGDYIPVTRDKESP